MIEYKKRIEEIREKSRREWNESRMERYGKFKLDVLEDLEKHLASFCEKHFYADKMTLNLIFPYGDDDFVQLFNEEKLIDLQLAYNKSSRLHVIF